MSFLGKIGGAFKKLGSVMIGVERVAIPILEVAEPGWAPLLAKVDGWINRTNVAVISAEHTITDAKAGGLKQAAVIQDFENGLETAQAALAVAGKTIQYDTEQYKKVVDSFVAAYNSAAAFKATWKIVDLPQTPAVPAKTP